MPEATKIKEIYRPSPEEQEKIRFVLEEFRDMQEVSDAPYREFNDRILAQFLDDSQKRANGYVRSREAQDKEEWQANVFSGMTRNKIRSFVASVAKEPPDIRITATNEQNEISIDRAEAMTHLVRHSYLVGDNPERIMSEDSWNCCVNGTVIKYDGILKTKQDVKKIVSYDPFSGSVKTETEERIVEDAIVEVNIPVNRFFVKNAFVPDVQDQTAVAWVEYYDNLDSFKYEFEKYKNSRFVQGGQASAESESDIFFGEQWLDRVRAGREKIEVIRYYNRLKDIYRIIANGVLVLDSPLLWGRRRKLYPFSKTIFESFANSSFFWGNSLPNILMPHQDIENSLYNSMLDKTHRTLVPTMLVGLENKDAFDLEDEFVTGDTKIYVDNVQNVKPVPTPPVNQSEIAMLKMAGEYGSLSSVDALQQGFGGTGSTAREIVLANEKADELKGLFFKNMKDLWIQKYRIRIMNIMTSYTQPVRTEKIAGGERMRTFYRQFNIPDTELEGGERGTLRIEMVEDRSQLLSPSEIGIREEMSSIQGRNLQIMMITSDFLDDYEYTFTVESETIFQKGRALDMALSSEKITTVAQLFPEIFLANKAKFFAEFIRQFQDSPEKYLEGAEQTPQLPQGMSNAPAPAPSPVAEQIRRPAQSLPRLSGVEV